jgi:hypothetical protein
MTTTEPSTPSTEAAKKAPRWRRALVAVLVVVSCILAPLSVISIWTRNQLLDTNRYVENVKPLASNPAILDAAAAEATNTLFDSIDVEQEAKDALPDKAQFLAGPLTTALRTFTETAALRALESDQFQEVWVRANTRAHDQVEAALTGGGKVISTKNGKVTVDLSAILLQVRELLDERGITIFDNVPINKLALKFELFDASGLEQAQSGVKLLNQLSYILPILLFVLLGFAIWLSPNRRRTIIRWGIGVTIAAAFFALLVAVGRGFYLDSVSSASFPRDALAATWDTLIRFLRGGLRALMVIGVLVAFITWLTGPGRNAVRLRTTATEMVGGMGDKAEDHGLDFGGFGRFVHRHHRALQVAGLLLVALFLLFANRISASRLLWAVVLLLVYLAVVQFISRAAKIEGEERTATSPTGPG